MSYLSYAKDFQGVGDIFLKDPARYLPFVQLLDEVMSSKSELTKTQKEMIALYASQLNGCHYCIASHSCVLTNLEANETLINSIVGDSTGLLDDKLRSVFKFTKKLTLKPGHINETDIDAILLAGWSENTIEDIICVVSTFAFLNRLVDGFGIHGTNDHFQQVGGMVSQQGYKPLVSMVQKKLTHSLQDKESATVR